METQQSIVLGGGCFWCLDAAYRIIKGVTSSVCGYAGGSEPNPTYEMVCNHETHHAEVVQLTFDASVITLQDILDVFWTIHDPTTLNRQGNDVGPQYRSIILYSDDAQKQTVEASVQEAQSVWGDPIVTEVQPLEIFYPAEDYHQDYFSKNPAQGYCQLIINPKLTKLRSKHASLMR